MKHICVAEQNTVALPIPSSVAIDLAPELAVLSLLDATCLIATRALACAHPEIGTIEHRPEATGCAPAFPSAAACTASCLISHLDALRFGITSYWHSMSRELPGVAVVPDQENSL
jgi:hypothetical protein